MQVPDLIAQGVANIAVIVRDVFNDIIGNGDITTVVLRANPQAYDIGSIL